MHYLIATAHTLGVRLLHRVERSRRAWTEARETGSVSLEQVLVGGLLAAIAIAAFAIVKAKVEAKANGLP